MFPTNTPPAYVIDGNGNLNYQSASGYVITLQSPINANRQYTYPDKSGTFALLSDIPTIGTTITDKGTATLVNGTVNVTSSKLTTSSIIIISYNTVSINGVAANGPGFLNVPVGSYSGTTFTINSYLTAAHGSVNTADQSTVNWILIN